MGSVSISLPQKAIVYFGTLGAFDEIRLIFLVWHRGHVLQSVSSTFWFCISLAHIHLVAWWDLIPNLNNCTSCHAVCEWQEYDFGIRSQISVLSSLFASVGGPQSWLLDPTVPASWKLNACTPAWTSAVLHLELAINWLSVLARGLHLSQFELRCGPGAGTDYYLIFGLSPRAPRTIRSENLVQPSCTCGFLRCWYAWAVSSREGSLISQVPMC